MADHVHVLVIIGSPPITEGAGGLAGRAVVRWKRRHGG
jgi:hypothetical protein